ncbi:MAG: UDP-3-O-(3-hydroxymyristoyl)glucosamine N-acyltransferase [Phycisphaerae bacterium]
MTQKATSMEHDVASLAALTKATLTGDATVRIARLASFDTATSGSLTFIRSADFAARWTSSAASAALVTPEIAARIEALGGATAGKALRGVADVDLAMIELLTVFAPAAAARPAGVHASAVVHPTARVAASAHVGPMCVIEEGASVGEKCVLHGQVTVAAGARIGDGTTLHSGVRVLERCEIGRVCILHANVVVGADGFGYRPRPDGRGLLKVPHIGNVVIGDDVEIGAGTCIDRGKFGATTIGSGTKIDNLVQIGHNCVLGRCCIICGNAGLAGSVTMGDGVVVGGGVCVADNLSIGSGAKIAGMAGVMNDVPAGATYIGAPAMNAGEWRRMQVQMRRLGRKT